MRNQKAGTACGAVCTHLVMLRVRTVGTSRSTFGDGGTSGALPAQSWRSCSSVPSVPDRVTVPGGDWPPTSTRLVTETEFLRICVFL